MSCWRVLDLSDASDPHIPQLLVKTEFGTKHYAVFLTDLNNIWSEELDLTAIIDRASEQESPIEVSKQDTTQLAILLDHVRKSLTSTDETTCRITRDDAGGIILHATATLPGPLDSLRWRFNLGKRTSTTLRNELILPLLVSSHIQHERMNNLIASITEKDKAITRLLDQFESSNLDLATAFPSIGGSKPGRRLIKREQAARHVPALQPFDKHTWKTGTGQLKDSRISTLALFQEALSECNPKVPAQMKAKDEQVSWWTSIGSTLSIPKDISNSGVKKPAKVVAPTTPQSEPSEIETEDEFETHEHFNQRGLLKKAPGPTPPLAQMPSVDSEESTEDEEDLDAAPRTQSHSQSRAPTKTSPPKAKSPEPRQSSPPRSSSSIVQKPKSFRIGGAKSKKPVVESPPLMASPELGNVVKEDDDSDIDVTLRSTRASVEPTASTGVKVARKPFKIGGKHRASNQDSVMSSPTRLSNKKVDAPTSTEPSVEPVPRNNMPAVKTEIEISPVEEHEETAEEKAERKRQELKRKNEELAKKQAQNKKKKRF